jgi:hypothetical protein
LEYNRLVGLVGGGRLSNLGGIRVVGRVSPAELAALRDVYEGVSP